MALRVLVVDDEGPARRRLARMLAALADVEVVGAAEDGLAAKERIASLAPDLVLLDIHMPGLDGLTLAESTQMPAIVFVTAHAEHAVRAFELAAVDYLLKPVTMERLAVAIDRARARRGSASDTIAAVLPAARDAAIAPRLAAKDGATTRLFELADVTRLFAADKYVVLLHDGREYLLERSLNDLERALVPFGFVRIHRAELVSFAAIRELNVEGGLARVALHDGQTAPVSRRALPELRRKLGLD
jgi:two-component system LytT family response regulator